MAEQIGRWLVVVVLSGLITGSLSACNGAAHTRTRAKAIEPLWRPLKAACQIDTDIVTGKQRVICPMPVFKTAMEKVVDLWELSELRGVSLEECRELAGVDASELAGCYTDLDLSRAHRWWWAGGGLGAGLILGAILALL